MAEQRVGAGQREAVVEDREPAQRLALGLGEQVPRPVDDRDQRLVPVGRAAVAAAQQREPVVEPAVDVLDRHHPHLGRGQLDRQRQPVEPAHDAAYGVVVERDARPGGRGALREQVGGGVTSLSWPSGKTRSAAIASGARVVVTTRSRRQVATRKATRSATASTTCSQLSRISSVGAWSSDLRDPGADVVALLGGEHPAAAHRVADTEGGADLADDVLRRGDADQLDEVHDRLLGLAAEQVRQPGLAEPAGAEDRGDPRVADGGTQRPDVLVAADQRGRPRSAAPRAPAGRRPAARRAAPAAPVRGRRRAGRPGRRGAARSARGPTGAPCTAAVERSRATTEASSSAPHAGEQRQRLVVVAQPRQGPAEDSGGDRPVPRPRRSRSSPSGPSAALPGAGRASASRARSRARTRSW